MSERRGVLSAGTWCVDFNKSIARWPDEDTSNEVFAIDSAITEAVLKSG